MARRGICSLILGLGVICLLQGMNAVAEPPIAFFETHIRPLLVEHCYECHSANSEKIKGGLLLDSREGLLKGGDSGPALVPGKPDESKIIIAVRHDDEDLQMPPKKKLSAKEVSLLEEWVKMGAPDPRQSDGHPAYRVEKELWSARPIKKPSAAVFASGVKALDPIDALIEAQLQKRDLKPAPRASKVALLRRVSFDLTGLPPTRAEVEAFLQDSSANAYEKVIDRLLQSPRFGEKWARHWLDLARYADSNGLDLNTPFDSAWRYRDYVISAFNSDKPYNQFIREQIAGDLLQAKDEEQLKEFWVATGFLMLGPKNILEPNREKLLMDIADEQIDVTCRAMLGLTVACARCHDHKFDPVPTRDYYALAGIFRSTAILREQQTGLDGGRGQLSERPLGKPEEVKAFEEFSTELNRLIAERDAARRLRANLPGGIDSKELDGIVVDNLDAEVVGNWKLSNYSTNFVDKNYLHDGSDKSGKGKALVLFRPTIPQEGFYEIRLAYTPRQNRATNVPVRVSTGATLKTVYLNQQVEPKYDKAFESLGVFQLPAGTNSTVEVSTEGTKGFVVVDAVQFLPKDVQLAAMLMKQRRALAEENPMMMVSGTVTEERLEEYSERIGELRERAPPPLPTALAVQEGRVQDAKIHIRGDPARLGEEVPRGFPGALRFSDPPRLSAQTSGRLELADWIASAQNPLTPRVMVNRIWQHLFGRGIVATADNFGVMGELPSHPELLDYLAAEFLENGWSCKKLIRRIVLSNTYQRSSRFDFDNFEKDPENVYLWRMNPRRLDAEPLRDAMLAVNGSLDPTMGGSLLDSTVTPGRMPQVAQDINSTRRSIYLPVFRGNVNDLFQVFDFPDPHALSGKRFTTAAPTQALFLMNSPFVLEQSRKWAEKLMAETGIDDAARVEEVYFTAYARSCSAEEIDAGLGFVRDFEGLLATVESDASQRKQKAWQAFCHAVYQSAEFRFLE